MSASDSASVSRQPSITIDKGFAVIRVPLSEPRLSSQGKSRLIGTYHSKGVVEYNGLPVSIGLNLMVPLDD